MTDETKQIIDVMKELFSTLNDKIDTSYQKLDQKIGISNQELNDKIDTSYHELKNEIKDVKNRIAKIETTLENETNKNIQLLSEGYLPLAEDVRQLKDDMEVVKFDIDIVKKVVTTHSTDINQLKKAK